MDAGLSDLGHGGWATELKLALLAELSAATTSVAALVATFSTNTHGCTDCMR
jgi:hypothetical protein